MKDKDVDKLIAALAPAVSRFIVTEAPTPRAHPAERLAGRLKGMALTVPVDWQTDPEAALEVAFTRSSRAIVAGSIFLVGPLRARLLARGAAPVRYPSKAPPFFLQR